MVIKRIFDIIFSFFGLIFLLPLIVLLILISTIDTKSFGLFFQKRVGQFAKLFTIYKIKTVNPKTEKISKWGNFLRKSKLDELPQLINILKGEMSVVGPRPDIEGYYDKLEGENLKVLELKPGLTSEASLKYADEEQLLEKQINPLQYNDCIIFPDKIKLNLEYYYKRNLFLDLIIIWKTIFK
ncbi:Sugar transferase involved in LPS biosynthesis (colanic, teichoic acid) [Halpernia humi]|uniref:Sugar transferase involved in LPS biosynthesis (Colanic, teichoic acid) n=1 Tax=Halpernia humi TaxID=493375 RepID=A0A1H6A0Y5_9FLAO|nr:sugar transferase [Halpernia humi]SEG42378.1 Sugar transferase involved in LPS biosynthesis (colanic, teichoic acid) [Halpernia humi]